MHAATETQEVDTNLGGEGSITITDAVVGETYTVYRMLDVTYNAQSGAYSYTVNSDWASFFAQNSISGTGGYVVIDTNGHVSWNGVTTSSGTIAAQFASLALAYAEENNISYTYQTVATTTGNETAVDLTFTELPYGYYLVDSSLGALCALDSTTPSASVADKNTSYVPTVEKEVKEDNGGNFGQSNVANFEEDVEFEIVITYPYNMSNLILHDTLPSGFTLNADSFSLYYGTVSGDYTIDSTYYTITTGTAYTSCGCSFEVAFDEDWLATLAQANKIYVYYTAHVEETASVGYTTPNVNTTWVTYGNSNTESEPSTTNTYIYDLYVYKYASVTDNTQNPPVTTETALAGASFILSVSTGEYATFDSNGNFTGWTSNSASATALTSDSDGLIHFTGLDSGTYYLTETEAPAGYTKAASYATITISDNGDVDAYVSCSASPTGYAVTVENSTSSKMPSTGGIGTTIFYIVGGVLVVGAVVLLITKKRMKSDNDK
ncbi:MAG: LPXTG cell wall anchor domain-containing protein [Oscillospiraceae bacterium]|nr:LPXTG cell wall anchor domain-containing protein [Oscillospiraceae bacterium]